MVDKRKAAIRAGLETLYFSGVHRLASQFLAGAGAILTFHRVRPASDRAFQPNRALEITPEYLDEVITALKERDVDLVSMDEARHRLVTGVSARRFVALTFDDGYRDTLQYAWPVLQAHHAPFALYVASAFPAGRGELWWIVLEEAIARNNELAITLDGIDHRFDCRTADAKYRTLGAIYDYLRSCPTEAELRGVARMIAARGRVDIGAVCHQACLGWDGIQKLAADPLVTIGAHTVTHPMLAKLSIEEARTEMVDGVQQIAAALGKTPVHFAYPVGAADACGPREFAIAEEVGFHTAVTTRPGVLFDEHADHLTALPRISVNGEFQRMRYLDVLLSGAPTALMNGFRRVAAA